MRKTTLDVTDLFSILDFAGVQKRLLPLPGVGAVEMTAASSSVTVICDPDRTDAANRPLPPLGRPREHRLSATKFWWADTGRHAPAEKLVGVFLEFTARA